MNYKISPDRHMLTITADENERQQMREFRDTSPEEFGTESNERDFIEHIVCNSELGWVQPADCGALTEAPILGIFGPECRKHNLPSTGHGSIFNGSDENGGWYQPILERWAYPHYALRSFLKDLIDNGTAVFVDSF